MTAPAQTVSVIVPTYRRSDHLRRCLTAVNALLPAPGEVLVVARTGDDETAIALCDFDRARCVSVDVPGVLAAMRQGVAAASGNVVVFLDDDAVPPPEWLGAILQQLADPAVGGACGRDVVAVGDEGLARLDVGRITAWGKLVGNHHLAAGEARDVEVLKGAAMVMRREALALPDRLRGSGAEVHWELATCLHAKRLGWRLRIDPSCRVMHLPGPRYDADRRSRPAPRASFDAAYNLVLCLLTFRPELVWRRALFGLGVGDAATPGIIRGLAAVVQGRWAIAYRTPASIAGQLTALLEFMRGRRVSMGTSDS